MDNDIPDEHAEPESSETDGDILDSVGARIAALVMGTLILAGIGAIVFIFLNRDTSDDDRPNSTFLNRDFAVVGSEVLSINPPLINGSCPAEAHFTAEIRTTGGEGTLVYRWFFDDAGPTEAQELSVEGGTTRVSVDLTKSLGGSDSKYEALSEQVSIQVLEQDGEAIPVASRKSSFTIACGS